MLRLERGDVVARRALAAALSLGWAVGADLTARFPLRGVRLAIAAALLVAAIWAGVVARGIV